MTSRQLRIVGITLFLLFLSLSPAMAQGYSVTIHCPTEWKGRLTVSAYTNDSVAERHSYRIREGEASFAGHVAKPCLVEVSHPSLAVPVCFFLENSNIDIEIDAAHPAASHITGSRINSQYRYALEQCPEMSAQCLGQLVSDNSSAVYTPYILSSHFGSIDPAQMQQLVSKLSGDAIHTCHYRQLVKRLATIMASTEGMRMPDFVYTNDNKQKVHFDSVRCDTAYSVILFTATYSSKGREIATQLQRDFPSLHTVIINIDKDSRQWDAPCLERLAVDRIPYMILLDDHGTIHTRDARIWELRRLISDK